MTTFIGYPAANHKQAKVLAAATASTLVVPVWTYGGGVGKAGSS